MLSRLPRSNRWLPSAVLLSLAVLGVAGCGGGGGDAVGSVEGTVSVNGVQANSGSVVFEVGKASISGQIQPDGTYRAVGVPTGNAQVSVQPAAIMPGAASTKDMPGMGPAVGKPVPIPPQYTKAATSGLTFTVKSGTNKYPITLGK